MIKKLSERSQKVAMEILECQGFRRHSFNKLSERSPENVVTSLKPLVIGTSRALTMTKVTDLSGEQVWTPAEIFVKTTLTPQHFIESSIQDYS